MNFKLQTVFSEAKDVACIALAFYTNEVAPKLEDGRAKATRIYQSKMAVDVRQKTMQGLVLAGLLTLMAVYLLVDKLCWWAFMALYQRPWASGLATEWALLVEFNSASSAELRVSIANMFWLFLGGQFTEDEMETVE